MVLNTSNAPAELRRRGCEALSLRGATVWVAPFCLFFFRFFLFSLFVFSFVFSFMFGFFFVVRSFFFVLCYIFILMSWQHAYFFFVERLCEMEQHGFRGTINVMRQKCLKRQAAHVLTSFRWDLYIIQIKQHSTCASVQVNVTLPPKNRKMKWTSYAPRASSKSFPRDREVQINLKAPKGDIYAMQHVWENFSKYFVLFQNIEDDIQLSACVVSLAFCWCFIFRRLFIVSTQKILWMFLIFFSSVYKWVMFRIFDYKVFKFFLFFKWNSFLKFKKVSYMFALKIKLYLFEKCLKSF